VIDTLDFAQKQTLLRLVVDEVHATGWHVQIRLRIPLDDDPDNPPRPPGPTPTPDQDTPVSTEDRLRSLRSDRRRVLPHAPGPNPTTTRRRQNQLINPRAEDFYLATSEDRKLALTAPPRWSAGAVRQAWLVSGARCGLGADGSE
jgi:hypothetical protein